MAIAVVGLGLGLARGACGEAKLKLKAEARVQGDVVKVGDVGVIEADDALKATLGEITIGPSPLPGADRVVTAGFVKLHLRRAGVDMAGVTVEGTSVMVMREEVAPIRPPAGPGAGNGASGGGGAAVVASPGELPPVVVVARRGDAVEVLVRSGAITVRTAGRLMENATAEGLVRVQIDHTNATVNATMTGPKSCEVRI